MPWLQKLIYKTFMLSLHRFQINTYNDLRKEQYLPAPELREKQLQKLNTLLKYAYRNVPYYRNLFDAGKLFEGGIATLQGLEDLNKIPFLNKAIIREQQDNLFSQKHKQRNSFRNSSGGTTGEPVCFMQDRYYADMTRSSFLLGKSWQGLTPYDSEIVLWGADRDTFSGRKPFSSHLKDFITNRKLLNCFVMSKKDMTRYLQLLSDSKGTVLRGYAEQLYELAKFAGENKFFVHPLRAVHSTAGNLKQHMRQEIEAVFGCKVYDYYGSREVGAIACECREHSGLHIFMSNNIVEVVNSQGNTCKAGELGEIVITNLNNFSMPLIRYRIGDMGILDNTAHCGCACNYPKLSRIVGRTSDLFVDRSGKIIDSDFITGLFYFKDWIKQFQIIQKDYDKILIKIVRQSQCPQQELDALTRNIQKVMGPDCLVAFDFVDRINKSQTGKIRYTICEVKKS